MIFEVIDLTKENFDSQRVKDRLNDLAALGFRPILATSSMIIMAKKIKEAES